MIYDFLKEYLVGSEQIDNDKLINIVRLLENPDSERKGMDFLGTQPEKKQKVKSGYTMYINGIEVGPETDITPGSVITIIIVYGSSQNITGNKSLEITSGTLDQTTDGFTIILQNMFIPLSLDGTFLEINAQAKENGIPLDGGQLFRVPIGDVQNVTGQITLVTTMTGLFTMGLSGVGITTIDWGDSSPIETITLPTGLITHMYSTIGGTILINTSFELTNIQADYQNITSVIIPKEFIKLLYIGFLGNQIDTFVTHKEWVDIQSLLLQINPVSVINTFVEWTNLRVLQAYSTNISVLNTFPEWTQLSVLTLGNSHLTSLDTFPEWVNLYALTISIEPGLTSVDTYAEWVNIQQLQIRLCPITSVNTFNTWTKLSTLDISSTNITSIDTFAEWTALQTLSLSQNQLTLIDTYPEWVLLYYINLSDNPLLYFNAYKEWTTMQYVLAENCALTNINDVLIQLDQTSIGINNQIKLGGGTSMGPFGLGLVAKASLITKGLMFVTTNTESFMSDIEGNQYAYRTIGTQVWTVENLKTTTYNDGSPIPNLTVNTDWVAQDGTENASDWFLPSVGEFEPMGTELYNHGLGNFVTGGPDSARYWNSTEANATTALTWDFVINGSAFTPKGNIQKIRACRAFYDLPGAYSLRSIGPAGGLIYIAQVIDVNRTLYYEAAPADLTPAAWSNVTTHLAGASSSSIGDGLSNTQLIINQHSSGVSWFLPCQNELIAMYTELHLHGVGGFVNSYYWSSTSDSNLSSYAQGFSGSSSGYALKTYVFNVRAATYFVSDNPLNLRDVGPHGGLIFAKILQSGITYQYYEAAPTDETAAIWSNAYSADISITHASVIGSGIPNTLAIVNFPSISGAAVECYTKDLPYAETTSAARNTVELITTGNGNGAYVWYNNNIVNKDIYGGLYNWFAINKKKYINSMGDEYGALYNWYVVGYNTGGASIAPVGWHVPTKTEWDTLGAYLGGIFSAGTHMKETGSTHWTPSDGDNTSGFSSRGSGGRNSVTGTYSSFNTGFFCWSSTVGTPGTYYEYENQVGSAIMSSAIRSPNYGQSIRLIKDDSIDPGTLTDIDGNIYPTVTIGTQVWMAKNLSVTRYNDGTTIPNIVNNSVWAGAVSGALCYYNNPIQTTIPIFAPTGWHVATNAEWAILSSYLGGDTISGGKMKEMGRWRWILSNGDATNESRLTITESGQRTSDAGFYPGAYQGTWSQTVQIPIASAYTEVVNQANGQFFAGVTDTRTGLPVRLVKD
jgi:uncharacterized protein (TIGR02145 family)